MFDMFPEFCVFVLFGYRPSPIQKCHAMAWCISRDRRLKLYVFIWSWWIWQLLGNPSCCEVLRIAMHLDSDLDWENACGSCRTMCFAVNMHLQSPRFTPDCKSAHRCTHVPTASKNGRLAVCRISVCDECRFFFRHCLISIHGKAALLTYRSPVTTLTHCVFNESEPPVTATSLVHYQYQWFLVRIARILHKSRRVHIAFAFPVL